MDEFIDKKIVLDLMRNIGILNASEQYMFEVIRHYPAADVAPVVRGRWIPEHHKDQVSQTEYHSYTWYRCSECGRRLIGYRDPREAPFCHCGAKME